MTIWHMDTADAGTTARWSAVQGTSISSTTARTGTYSYYQLGNTGKLDKSFGGSSSTMYTKHGDYFPYGEDNLYKLLFYEGSTVHLAIRFQVASGHVAAWRADATSLGSVYAGVITNQWLCFETKVVVDDSSGVVQIKVDGDLVLDLSSQDTRNGGSGYVDRVVWHYNSGASRQRYLDDLVIRDDTWPGLGGVLVIPVDSAGDSTQWTPSTGSNYECVDEIPATYTDYVSTAGTNIGYLDLYNLESLPAGVTNVNGVGVVSLAKLNDTGVGFIRHNMKYSGTTVNGASTALSTVDKYPAYYRTTDPTDSAWTVAAFNALQIGQEVVGS